MIKRTRICDQTMLLTLGLGFLVLIKFHSIIIGLRELPLARFQSWQLNRSDNIINQQLSRANSQRRKTLLDISTKPINVYYHPCHTTNVSAAIPNQPFLQTLYPPYNKIRTTITWESASTTKSYSKYKCADIYI